MNNLQIFRHTVASFLRRDQIETEGQFKELINHLCDNKLLRPQEVQKLLAREKKCFPLSVTQLQSIIMTEFGDAATNLLLLVMRDMQKRLRDTKGIMNVWMNEGMSEPQRLELTRIFQVGTDKARQLVRSLADKKKQLEEISEQQVQMVQAMEQWVVMQKLTEQYRDHHEYIKYNKKAGDAVFDRLRVREVHFKKGEGEETQLPYRECIGYDSRNDEPLWVLLVRKKLVAYEQFETILTTFNARKELILSKYYPRFLGFTANSNHYLYFTQWRNSRNLAEVVSKSPIELDEDTPIFQYWIYMIYQALYDAFLMCSYALTLPISLSHFQIYDEGLGLSLKSSRFHGERTHQYEAQLLRTLGELGRELVKGKAWKNIQNRCLFQCLENAVKMHENYEGKKVPCRVTFFNLQTHPIFESKDQIDGETIIDNYIAISK